MAKVLVAEKIAQSGIEVLREHFDVDTNFGLSRDQLASQIAQYDAILIRSATQLDAELLAKAQRLKVIGRAGIGVDNVDVKAATKYGIIVANAPQSNIVAAAEHTVALMLALARNIPLAHQSLTEGRWERSKFSGVELFDKRLGVLGFGRIGQLVAQRARGFGMTVFGFDPYVASERFRDLHVEQVDSAQELYRNVDFLTLHLPRTDETRGWLNQAAFAQMKQGIRIVNCARGELIVDQDLKAAIDDRIVAGAALDVFTSEPITEHPLFGYENVVVTPHLGASTSEAQDRAGIQTAEQIVAALTGGVVSTAVNVPSLSREELEVLQPFLPLCERLGRLAIALAQAGAIDRIDVEFRGSIAGCDTRMLTVAILKGVLAGHAADEVNYVNAPSVADERGIRVSESSDRVAHDFTDLVRVIVTSKDQSVRIVGTTLGQRHRPHLLEAWGQRFNLQIDDPYIALFRYHDLPGMIGRVGSLFGEHGINISAAAVGREPPGSSNNIDIAVMAVTTDTPIPSRLIDRIVESERFLAGRAVNLAGTSTAPVGVDAATSVG